MLYNIIYYTVLPRNAANNDSNAENEDTIQTKITRKRHTHTHRTSMNERKMLIAEKKTVNGNNNMTKMDLLKV